MKIETIFTDASRRWPRSAGAKSPERRAQPMPRPKLEEDRQRLHPILIRLTGPEWRAVRDRAKSMKLRPSALARAATLATVSSPPARASGNDRGAVAHDPEAVALRREIRRLASNLNQTLKLAHAGQDADLRTAVERLAAAVENVRAPS